MSRVGKMLKNGRTMFHKSGRYLGCSCCNDKNTRRKSARAARANEKRQWKREESA